MRFPRLPLVALVLAAAPLAAQQTASPAIPGDTAVRTGTLPNGLRYWIRRHDTPAKRLELRLVVRAGSIQEDPDQRGLAHFVEHMAFNGTTRFAKNDLVHYLESIGVRFGADLNASTSFDETVYILPVPSDKPDLVERAFDILQDWAGGVRFDSAEVVAERGVVMGEWRSGLGVQSRIQDKEFPLLFRGSRYAERLPIGDTGTIAHAQPAPLRRFYRDWYRPDLMAIVAVGDVSPLVLEALIKERFGKLANPARPRPRVDAPIPENPGTRVSILTDPELTAESVQLLVRRPGHGPYRTEDDERRFLLNAVLSTVASQRLADVARRPATTFVAASFGPARLIRDVELFALSVVAKEGKTEAAFGEVLTELRRLERHGVLPAELERARATLLRAREQQALEQDKQFSGAFVAQYLDAYLNGSVTPSARTRFALAQKLLPTITLDEVNAAARDGARGSDRFIAVRAPEKTGAALPTRESLLAVLARTDTATVAPWTETTVAGPLVPAPPAPGRITGERRHPGLGITEWTLSNGARVLVKPTDFKVGEIFFAATSAGGLSQLPDSLLLHGRFATAVAQQSGFGAFDAPALRRRMAGTVAMVLPAVTETEEMIIGATAPKDLATFFELFWLTVTAPRLDSTAVAAFKAQMQTQLANRDRSPQTAFGDTVSLTMARNAPRAQPLTAERFAAFDERRALAIYRDRFADVGGFTFFIVGNVTPDSIRPLVERWLGGLPSSGRRETPRDPLPAPPEGVITKRVLKGKEPTATQLVLFTGPTTAFDAQEELAADAVGEILQTRLLEKLREAMGATYGANAATSLDRIPALRYRSMIQFTSAPGQVDTLWAAAQAEIAALRDRGPTPEELQKYVEQARRAEEVGVKTNAWWLDAVMTRITNGIPLDDLPDWGKRLDALTPAMVQAAAKRYLDPSRVARFLLLPEGGSTP